MAAVVYRSLEISNCVFEISLEWTHHGLSAGTFWSRQLEGQFQLVCVWAVGKAAAQSLCIYGLNNKDNSLHSVWCLKVDASYMFALEASGTVLLREEAPHLENRWKTSVWSKVSAETKDPRREEIWQEVSQQANGEKWVWKGGEEEKLMEVRQREAGISGNEPRTTNPADEEGLIPASSESKSAY